MKLIFLHGLGQDASSWQAVQAELSEWQTEAPDLFPQKKEDYPTCKQALLTYLRSQTEDFLLIGLSLGGVLALDLSDQDLPHLKGLILSGSQYKLSGNFLYKLQILLFKLLPKGIFEKQGANKEQMLGILTALKDLDLTQKAQNCPLPTLILCGSQDKPNLTASRELHGLIKQSTLTIIPNGGHTLNTGKAKAFAQAVSDFSARF